jgi:hypothetical protein
MNEPMTSEAHDLPQDAPPIQGVEERQAEELRMLMIGFGTGLTVAVLFLIYVVLDIAHLL